MNGAIVKSWNYVRRSRSYKEIAKALWEANPISRQILGICSALAVTVQMKTAIVMSIALTCVVAFSNLIVSMLRAQIPRNIRIIVQVVVIATLVILADELLKAFMYDISKQLTVFVGLIITNCIVLGRAEAYLGYQVIPQAFYNAGYENMGLMLLAPGAFIIIGLFVWLENTLLKK
jgi:Na+-transporting NADH:ubiquinone oxidoreductase subunit D